MSGHRIILQAVDEGYCAWAFECTHAVDDHRWFCRTESGDPSNPSNPSADGCWLKSWWDELGTELLQITNPPRIAINVKPDARWSYDDGGLIVGADQ